LRLPGRFDLAVPDGVVASSACARDGDPPEKENEVLVLLDVVVAVAAGEALDGDGSGSINANPPGAGAEPPGNKNPPDPIDPPTAADDPDVAVAPLSDDSARPGFGVSQAAHVGVLAAFVTKQDSHFHVPSFAWTPKTPQPPVLPPVAPRPLAAAEAADGAGNPKRPP